MGMVLYTRDRTEMKYTEVSRVMAQGFSATRYSGKKWTSCMICEYI